MYRVQVADPAALLRTPFWTENAKVAMDAEVTPRQWRTLCVPCAHRVVVSPGGVYGYEGSQFSPPASMTYTGIRL